MKIGVVGGGALGLLFAARCCEVANVSLITRRREQAEEVLSQGLVYHWQGNKSLHFPHAASISEAAEYDWEWLLIMVKQHQIDESFLQQLKPLVNAGTKLLCFQNGIGHMERLQSIVEINSLFAAVTTEAAHKQNARTVYHTGRGLTRMESDTAASDLIKILNGAGFNTEMSKNMDSIIWSKLLINAVINPLTAILKVRNGQLLSSQQWLQLMEQLLHEGCEVADKSGIANVPEIWQQLLEVCHQTAQNESSMLQDIKNGRKTEIDAINGIIIQRAKQLQISVPAHETIYRLIKGIEAGGIV